MNRIKVFVGRLRKTLFTHKPCKPITREVRDAIAKKDQTLYLIYEIARQSVCAR